MIQHTKILILFLVQLFLLAPHAYAESNQEQPPTNNLKLDDRLNIAIPMRIAALHGNEFYYIQALEKLAVAIDSESEGRIKVELLLAGAAGSEAEALKKLIRNRLEGGFTSANTLAHSLPAFRLLTIPLLFTAPSHVKRFIGSQQDMLLRETANEKNLKVLGYGSYGFYGLLSFAKAAKTEASYIDPGTKPEDGSSEAISEMVADMRSPNYGTFAPQPKPSFAGLAVRVPKDKWMEHIHEPLGIKQLLVPIADLPDAIESGWVEGVVSTPESFDNTSYPQTATYYFDIRQQHGWSVFTVNKKWFSQLPHDLKLVVSEAVASLSQEMLDIAFHREQITKAAWSRAGWPQIIVPAPEELEAAFRPLVFKIAREVGKIVQSPRQIQELWENNRSSQSSSWPALPDGKYIELPVAPPQPALRKAEPPVEDEIQKLMMLDELERRDEESNHR